MVSTSVSSTTPPECTSLSPQAPPVAGGSGGQGPLTQTAPLGSQKRDSSNFTHHGPLEPQLLARAAELVHGQKVVHLLILPE